MAITFHKLHSSGNDFLFLFENENNCLKDIEKADVIRSVCHRQYGLGADGVFFVYEEGKIIHYDSDGSESFCINGSLCLAKLKPDYPSIPDKFVLCGVEVFVEHSENPKVCFKPFSPKVEKVTVKGKQGLFVEIGNPHFFVRDCERDINLAKDIRYSDAFEKGVNVSFVKEIERGRFRIATYERGVENFTLACGSACAAFTLGYGLDSAVFVPLSGIPLKVKYNSDSGFITVEGSVCYVAKGVFFN